MSKYKLVCFDVDGTLVDNITFSWQLFHEYFKTDENKRQQARTKYFNGEISYLDWANHDIEMWLEKGAKKQDFFKALKTNNVKLMQGALETIKTLKQNNIKLAVISGSMDIILEHVLPNYKDYFNDIYLSWMHFDKQGNVKKVDVTDYDMQKKADALKLIAKKENLKLSECVFIGDHHNDVKIAEEAGLSIAFDPKDKELEKTANITIKYKDLREVLKFIL